MAPADLIRAWHAAARRLVGRGRAGGPGRRSGGCRRRADSPARPAPGRGRPPGRRRRSRSEAAWTAQQVLIQRVHGDLHVGQILRWPGGLAVVDFHPCPLVEVDGLAVGQAMQPAARDVARLLRSLDHVARVVDKGTGFAMTDRVDAWSRAARERLLDAYRSELAERGTAAASGRATVACLRGRAALQRDRLRQRASAVLGVRAARRSVAVLRVRLRHERREVGADVAARRRRPPVGDGMGDGRAPRGLSPGFQRCRSPFVARCGSPSSGRTRPAVSDSLSIRYVPIYPLKPYYNQTLISTKRVPE